MKKENIALLSCCAPCCVGVLKFFLEQNISSSVIFYNPNIFPESEYLKRRDENQKLCSELKIPFIELEPDRRAWKEAIQGLELLPERSQRCSICFYLRLKKAALFAKQAGFTIFSSVLGVSRHKDMNQVNAEGYKVSQEVNFPYLDTDWRKNGIEIKRQQGIKEYCLYKQLYCGCPYSMKTR